MVNYCVCAGCKNSTQTGHRVHGFPMKNKATLRQWVKFVCVRRANFSMSSVTTNAKICSAHFREEDYDPGHIRMVSLGLMRLRQILTDASTQETVDSVGATIDDPLPSSSTCDTETQCYVKPPGMSHGEEEAIRRNYSRRNYGHTIVKMEIKEEPCRIKDEDTEEQIGEEEASRRNYSRRNYGHTIIKMEIKEEPCRIKDEDTEEQIDPMDVKGLKHEFRRPQSSNEDGNAVISQTENNFMLKSAGKSGVSGSLTCSQCGNSFTNASNLKKHMRIHTGEKPFTCIQCEKSFGCKSSLEDHLPSHSGVRSFSCDQCDKTFVYSSNLRAHLNVHTGVKPHFCSFCGKSFSRLENLKEHESFHTGVRPYVCFDCGKTFIKSSHLKQHQRVHTGEKPFKCSHCGKSFAQSGSLKDHERIHTGEKPHQCFLCGKSFTQLSNLQKHEKKYCLMLPK